MPFENAVPSQLIWVSPDGNDSNTGTQDAPLQSIQFAIDRATPGTAVMLLPGDYTGNYVFDKIQGTPDKPIWLAAADGPGSVTITAASNESSVLTIRGEDNLIIRDLKTVGGYDGIEVSQSGTNYTDLVNNLVLQGNTIVNAANDGIKVGQTNNALILDNTVNGTTSGQGIDMLADTHVIVDGNEIMNVSGSSGIFMKGGSSDLTITNNYIHDIPGGDGLLVGGWTSVGLSRPGTDYEASNVTVTGNVVENAEKRPLSVEGAQNVDIHGNWFGSMPSNEAVILVSSGSPDLSPPPPSIDVAIHDNVFDRSDNLAQIDPGSQTISIFDNQQDGVIQGDMRPNPPNPAPPGFESTLPDALLSDPLWPTSARSTHSFTSGSGSQTLIGTDGNDFLSGGSGTDTTIGGKGDDTYSVSSSHDIVVEYPGEGIDTVIAYGSSFALPANVENLTVANYNGGSYSGNELNNIITGGSGNDTLTGGAGADLFVASTTGGQDIITDFTPADGDRIDLRSVPGFANLADVMAHTTQNGSAAVVALGDNATLTLNGVNATDLTSSDFLFQPVSGPAEPAPTAIAISNASISEAAPQGGVVGTLMGIDADPHNTLSYALVDNPGGIFAINNDNQLILANPVDYETATSHSVTVRVTDSAHQTFDQAFDIAVNDAPPSTPTDADTAPNSVVEGAADGTPVGLTAQAFDPNGGDVTYSLADNAGGRFAIDPTTGVVTVADGALLDYTIAKSHDIVVAAADSSGEASTATFAIGVTTDVVGVTIVGTDGPDLIDATHTAPGQPLPTVAGDTIYGGAGNDTINALDGNDVLIGGPGADVLDGGPGVDTASYAGAPAHIAVSLAAGTGTAGDAAGDVLWNIENVTGSSYPDTIEGDGGNNVLTGGNGVDTLSYEHATAGVTIDLSTDQPQDTVGAGIDTITGFEYVTGSAFDDTITGSKIDNVLKGGAGNDVLSGGGGNDLLVGGAGNDTLIGGTGADGFIYNSPGEGADTITDFVSGTDWLRISASGFGGGLAAGHQPMLLTTNDLTSISAPAGAGDFILDNADPTSGALYWDPTGGTAEDATLVARLTGVTHLTASDLHVIA